MGKPSLRPDREKQLQQLLEDIRKMIAELKTLINDTRAAIATSQDLLRRLAEPANEKGRL